MADVLVLFGGRPDIPLTVGQRHLDAIQAVCSGKVYYYESEEVAIKDGVDAEVLFMWGGSGKMPEEWCATSKRLKWINSFSAGVNPIMDCSISQLPVLLTNARGIHGKTMGVTTMGYIISFLRHFPTMMRQQKAHVWDKTSVTYMEPTGLTVGIIGAGAIAAEVARLAKAMDMHVLGVKRTVQPLENYDMVYSNTDMDKVLAQSDFVVLLTPLTNETRHLIGEKEFALMKNTAVLINISRGPVADTDALISALQNGEIGGAALDAVDPEPLPSDSPLWDMDNVIITPHCAADSTMYLDRAIALFCENLKHYESGEPMFNLIDMKQKY